MSAHAINGKTVLIAAGAVYVTPIGLTDQGKFDTAWPDGFFPERTVEVLPAKARVTCPDSPRH